MKINIKIVLYISIFIFLITNTKCTITIEEFEDFFENMTIDRMRQIYWNIIMDVNNKSSSSQGTMLSIDFMGDYLHSMPKREIIENLYECLRRLSSFPYYLDINYFKGNISNIELFYYNKDFDLNSFPKNILINFAINIDKYERTIERRIDGINDYINYYTKEKIIEYIEEKMDKYQELKSNFSTLVLNNITLKYNDINNYIENKTIEELIQIIYGFENYLFNEEKNNEVYYYSVYNHEDLINKNNNEKDRKDLSNYITMYNKEASITNIDDFISKIENRNFQYICHFYLFKTINISNPNILLAFEKYYKRQMNITKSLRGLNEYIEKMEPRYKEKILEWGFKLFPELYIPGIFQDIISNEINYQYGQVKEYIQVNERNIVLRYAYNIHTFQNNIESIYDDSLFNVYRYKNEKLYDLILSDTNLNKNLQEKKNFIIFAELYKDNFFKYLENLERNQLKKIVKVIIESFYNDNQFAYDKFQIPSEKFSAIEYNINADTVNILYEAEKYLNTTINSNYYSTSKFFELNKELIGNYTNNTFGYYYNIMDFLRSTNIFYLKLWLRKYEMIIRKKKLYINIEGGLKNNFLNDNKTTKKEILEIFDIYLEEYPELFEPKKFIDIVGLNNDITPHKKLVELFDNINNNKEIIMRISYSLCGYFQRKNIQTLFDIEAFLNEFKNRIYSNNQNCEKYLFQLFRIINIFPELSNKKLFEFICINNDSRIINLYEDNYLQKYYNRDKIKICKNIQYYYNITKYYDNKHFDKMNEEELKKYILDFLEDKLIVEKNDLKSCILDGYFYPIFYDHYENYLNNIDEDHFNFIFNNIKNKCSENYPCLNESNATSLYEKKVEIINDIKNVEEFQNTNFFDKYFDYISDIKEDKLYEFLFNSTNKNIILYTIMANIIKLETIEKGDNIDINNLPEDIYLKIHYMSRNEMIRYILKINEINKKMVNADILPFLVRYYKLDIGSDYIYDLTLY